MMDIFDSLANAREDEVEDLVALESAEIAAEKACLAYNYARDLQDLRNAEAELKWYAESGDADALIGYYEAAKNSEAEQKTEGLLKKAWAAIKNLFEKIKNKLFKKKIDPPKDPKTKVRVPKALALVIKKIKGAWAAVKSAVISGKKKLSENGNWKKLLLVLGVVGVVGAATYKKTTYEKLPDNGLPGPAQRAQIEDKSMVEVTTGQIVDAKGVIIEMVDTTVKVADAGQKNPDSQVAENADALKAVGPVLTQIGTQLNQCLALPDKKIQYAGGPTSDVIQMDGPTNRVIPMGGPDASTDKVLSSMSNEKLSRLVKKCIVARDGESAWEAEKSGWEPKKLDKTQAIRLIKSGLKRRDIDPEHVTAMESVSDEYIALDMDGFMESNYGDDIDADDFFENL